ncbi:ROK family transcriptional regulator [Jannaschia sp. LMIT008]|uniref:ROK family transcriptional regulator n=1 Tax=Jannaschia maritima TaxID=3032585 RepID=UPI002811B691|nr:ROK family transcriptional regulator [Jannaschia sp. LMIT008]
MTTAPDHPRRGANAARSRDHNRQLVLGQLHAGGALGRAEIARRSGLTTQAVSNIIADLEAEGLLRPAGAARGRRGLPAIQYAVNPAGAYALGVEIRPAALLATLLDLGGGPVWQGRVAVEAADPDAVAAPLRALRDAALSAVPPGGGRVLGAGVAMPGPFGRTALSGQATDLPGWQDADPAARLADMLDLDVVVENDANAAAMAERIALAPEGIDTFACLYFGTGLGLGIVQDGRLVLGAHGNAGEVGQIPIPGAAGGAVPLEHALSRASVERHLRLSGRDAREMDAVAALHARGDGAMREWIATAAAALSHVLTLIENMLDPRTVVLCGAMPAPVLRDVIAATALSPTVSRRPDATAPLRVGTCSRMAAARGGAALMLSRAFTPALAA